MNRLNVLNKFNKLSSCRSGQSWAAYWKTLLSDGNPFAIYDATDLTTITKDEWNYVSEWRDLLGVGPALTQATDLNKFHWTPSGMYMDGVEDYMKIVASTLNQPVTIYVVFRQKKWIANDTLFDGNTVASCQVYQKTSNPNLSAYAGSDSSLIEAGVPNEEWNILSVVFNGANSRATLNNGTPVTGNFGANNFAGFTVGGKGNGTALMNADVKYIIIRTVADTVAKELQIYNGLHGHYYGDAAADLFDSGICVFTFDNGNETILTEGKPIFDARNKKFTAYINGALVGINDTLNVHNADWTQLKTMFDAGYDIQCHGETHAKFESLSEAALIAELQYNDTYFIANGINPPRHTAYPEVSVMTQSVLGVMRLYRDSGRLFSNSANDDPFNYVYKGTDRYLWKELNIDVNNVNAVVEAKASIDFAVTNKCAVVFCGHDINNAGGTYSTPTANLTEILDYAVASGITIMTHSELYEAVGFVAAPIISWATTNTARNKIYLKFNSGIDIRLPATSAFSVSGGKNITAINIDSTRTIVILTVDVAYGAGDSITCSYTQPAALPLKSVAGVKVVSFTNQAVTKDGYFVDQYFAVYEKFATKPSSSVATAQDTFMRAIVTGGVRAKLDMMLVLAAHTNTGGEELLDWIVPTRSATKVGLPTFNAYQGYSAASSTKYINTGYSPSTGVNKFLLNDSSFGVYQRTNRAAADAMAVCASVLSTYDYAAALQLRYTDLFMSKHNESTWKSVANTDARGLFISSRLASAGFSIYKNKVKTDVVQESQALVDTNFIVFTGIGKDGLIKNIVETGELSMVYFGGGLSEAEVGILTDAFEAYMDSNGKGVIA